MKFTKAMVFVLGCLGAMGYFFLSGTLTRELFFILALGVFAGAFWFSQEKEIISIQKAAHIAYEYMRSLQEQKRIPAGTIRIQEIERKDIVLKTAQSPTVKADRFIIKIHLEPNRAYVVLVSAYGSVLGYYEVKIPSRFSVADVKEREFEASLVRQEPPKEEEEDVAENLY